MKDRKVILSVKDLEVKFKVRGRVLQAIRGINLDIYENESIAIVGESGSGKSVFTKTFAGMLEDNGFISNGDIIYNDEELSDTIVSYHKGARFLVDKIFDKLNQYTKYEKAAPIYHQIIDLVNSRKEKENLNEAELEEHNNQIADLNFKKTEAYNLKQTLDPKKDKEEIARLAIEIKEYENAIKVCENEKNQIRKEHKALVNADIEYINEYNNKLEELRAKYKDALDTAVVSEEDTRRNFILAKEIYLSVGRYPLLSRINLIIKLVNAIKKAMILGVDLDNVKYINQVFDTVAFRVAYIDETEDVLHGCCQLNFAKIKYARDWQQIRGKKIATVFQDPMTSLNPIITIGEQISSIIIKHQKVSEGEARIKAIELMKKVGIPNAENRYDDYPFQYSGGMRQRIVIAIALSCQPKILICDEPTTALDVTIQAQILKLIKDLQKEFNYTIVFITHDLGVVANVADRVAVLYAGQIVELGTVEEIYADPRHPYTWALLSSMPQPAEKNTVLYSISGTPPSLYNKIVGDPFAPRNPYCLEVDKVYDSPMFKISDTHYAKTWLLDKRAPKVEKPDTIKDIHTKLINYFNIKVDE